MFVNTLKTLIFIMILPVIGIIHFGQKFIQLKNKIISNLSINIILLYLNIYQWHTVSKRHLLN